MTVRHHTTALLCAALSMVGVACDEGEDLTIPTFEATRIGPLLPCAEGSYDREQINAELADYPELAQELGIDEVQTCEDASAYFGAYTDFIESLPSAEEDRVSDDPSDFRIASADGTNLSTGGVLEIPGCTGVLITERALITAAHCVDQYSPDGSRNYWKTGFTIKDFGSTEWTGTVRINVHPNWTGGDFGGQTDVADDIAVVKILSGSFGFPNSHRHRLYKGYMSTIGWMKMFGRGNSSNSGGGSGTLRFMNFKADWSGPYHFLMYADDPSRVCKGDSGGPVRDLTPSNGYPTVAGLLTSMQVSTVGVNRCAADGGKQRATRLQHKIRWIDDMIGGSDDDDCTTFHDNGWVYERCW